MATGETTAWKQLAGAITRLEAEQAKLRRSVETFRSTLGDLQTGVDLIGTNLGRFHGSLETVRVGADKLGAKSRKLAATMDGYLVRHGAPVDTSLPASQPIPAAALSRAA